jgi:nucleoside-diphosphate-sugar epimerase
MILLTGGSGQLGRELRELGDYVAPTRLELDVTDQRQVYQKLQELEPDLIVHAAAYTNTLGADHDVDQMVTCWQTNVIGTRNLVDHAECPIVYISTEAAIHPYSFYILSKLQGEMEVARHKHGYTNIRTSFREDPFEYSRAFTDMWTIGDYTTIIARLINELVERNPVQGRTVWVGTGAKTVFQLAARTCPDVKPILRGEHSPYLPSLEELVDV